MSTPVLQVQQLRVRMGQRAVVHALDISIPAGVWVSVVGPNGAGKTSALKAIAGLLPFEGQVLLQGQALHAWPPRRRAQQLAWMGQAESGSDDLRALDVVMLGRLPHRRWWQAASDKDHSAAAWAMQQMRCWEMRQRRLGQLSGGERQRVLLARALAVQAPVLLMDEPLAHVDVPLQADWLQTVRSLVAQGNTVVSVLHGLNMALRADWMAVMQAGQLVHFGQPSDSATHLALCEVFDQRLHIQRVGAQWMTWPKS